MDKGGISENRSLWDELIQEDILLIVALEVIFWNLIFFSIGIKKLAILKYNQPVN